MMNVSSLPKICLLLGMLALIMESNSCQGSPSGSQKSSTLNLSDGREAVIWKRQNELTTKRGKRHEGPSLRCRIAREAPASAHGIIKRSTSQFEADKGRCLTHERRRRQIMLGTHWCGNGDKAEHYNDLGYYSNVDTCCREHDHCDQYVAGDSTDFGVTNDTPYTWSDCACDDKFRNCLHKVDSFMADLVGKMFFDIISNSMCLEFDSPTKATAVSKGTYAGRDSGSESSWWSWFG